MSVPTNSQDKKTCPNCGNLMDKQSEYNGGTASVWEKYPVSSTGSYVPIIYPQQEIYRCPHCGNLLLTDK